MKKISRKGFLKVAAAAAMSGVTASALAACNAGSSSSTAASTGEAIYTPGTYTGTATGIGEVKVTMTFSETAITDVVIDASNETESIGGVAAPTLKDALMAAQSTEIDNISGATITTNAVKKAAASCIEQAMGVHCLLELGVEVPAVGGVDLGLQLAHLFHQGVEVGVRIGHLLTDFIESGDLLGNRAERHLDVLAHGLGVVQRRLLLQDADREARGQAGLAVAHGLQAGHNLQQGGLAHAVRAHDADLRAGQEAQGHVIENHAVAVGFTGLDHLKHKFSHMLPYRSRNADFPTFCGTRTPQ